jgi:hypothetical protein
MISMSFSPTTKPARLRLKGSATGSKKDGLKVWLDRWNLLPGDPWQDEIEEALDRSRTVAVFAGLSGIGGWRNEERRQRLKRASLIAVALFVSKRQLDF